LANKVIATGIFARKVYTIQLITILDKSEEASIKKEDVVRLIKKSGL
jgi:hypothetical protein